MKDGNTTFGEDSRHDALLRTGTPSPSTIGRDAATELMRHKVAAILAEGPRMHQSADNTSIASELSPHVRFLYTLLDSGKSLSEMIAAWHEYYDRLGTAEKHALWKEFYTPIVPGSSGLPDAVVPVRLPEKPLPQVPYRPLFRPTQPQAQTQTEPEPAETADSVQTATQRVFSLKRQLKSLAFGLATGLIVMIVFLFGFFKETVLSAVVHPSRSLSGVPFIVDPASASKAPEDTKVIIPKINVEIPVDYSLTTTADNAVQQALDRGVVHYPATVRPGQEGNAAFFGHSSNNFFNPGKYKFAFVLLHKLVPEDVFYLSYGGKMYAYEVIMTRVVPPSEVSVLGPVAGEKATATLITCDPPGTSLNRLVVTGRQISPQVASNTKPTEITPINATKDSLGNLPGEGSSLWGKLWDAIF